MAKPSNREKILTEGLRVVHEHGFAGASVRDIVHAAGVPQGSFTNHFTSKEAFGLEIIDRYFADGCEVMRETLLNDARPPLERLRAYISGSRACPDDDNMRNGCLFGNFAAEACDSSEAIRCRLVEIFGEVQQSVAYCLRAAVTAGELPAEFDCDGVAECIVFSLQGAHLLAKAQRSAGPVERLEEILFTKVLR